MTAVLESQPQLVDQPAEIIYIAGGHGGSNLPPRDFDDGGGNNESNNGPVPARHPNRFLEIASFMLGRPLQLLRRNNVPRHMSSYFDESMK
ncbi:MAG TPA: hypothetical protein VLF90_02210 [Patescibacteria group bacterium]|nr:hypothetical protein [Patescibacteria group bacterium]